MKDTQSTHPYCGKCLFCLSTCPDCRSTRVTVNLETGYYFNNEEPGRIQVWRRGHRVSIACKDCGGSFPADHPAMRVLAAEAAESIGLAHCFEFTITATGEIQKQGYFLKTQWRPAHCTGLNRPPEH